MNAAKGKSKSIETKKRMCIAQKNPIIQLKIQQTRRNNNLLKLKENIKWPNAELPKTNEAQ